MVLVIALNGILFCGKNSAALPPTHTRVKSETTFVPDSRELTLFFCFVFVCLAFFFWSFFFTWPAFARRLRQPKPAGLATERPRGFQLRGRAAILSVFFAQTGATALVLLSSKGFLERPRAFSSWSSCDAWPMRHVCLHGKCKLRNDRQKKKEINKTSNHRDPCGCILRLQTLNWRHSLRAAHSVCSQ